MSQMHVVVDVTFDDDYDPSYPKTMMARFEPLVEWGVDEEEAIKRTLANMESRDDRYRLEMLAKLWPKYLAWGDKMERVTDFEYRMQFTLGSSGMEFIRDFAFMLASNPKVNKVDVACWSHDYFYNEDDDTEYGWELVLDKKAMWRKVDA